MPRRVSSLLLTALVVALVGAPAPARADAPQIGIDQLRTSWDPAEPRLSPGVVGSSTFGTIFSTPVDGQVYAMPVTAGGTLVAATEANAVYGLDPASGAVRWQRRLGRAWSPAVLGCGDLTPTIGVTATPVYDAGTGTVYLTSKVDDGPDVWHPHWYVHALDAATGAERTGWPVRIEGAPSNDPAHPFDPLTAMQRPGLLLLGGTVYAAFASHCDTSPYNGYVVGVDAAHARIRTIWASESGSAYDEGGIWQSGSGLVSDGPRSILLTTGNGLSPAPGPGSRPPSTLAESVVRLRVAADGTLAATDFFSPSNNRALDQDDFDLGSGGPLALPDAAGTAAHPHLLVQIGKDGRVYLLDRDDLGGMGQAPGGGDAVLGRTGPYGGLWGKPAWFGADMGSGGGYVYVAEANGPLRAHALRRNASGVPSLVSVGTSAGSLGYTSGSPVVTSVGGDPVTALVWVVVVNGSDGSGAELRAYDAVPDSSGILRQRFARAIGTGAKFSSVATDGGRVYVGTRDGRVLGFGAPTTAGVKGKGTDFGMVAVGSRTTRTVRLTATRAVTLTAASAQAPFSTPALAAPKRLAKGQSLDLRVAFAPGAAGSSAGSLDLQVRAGADTATTSLDLRGYGTRPGLLATPAGLDFGTLVTGAPRELSVNLTNVGRTPATITGLSTPGAPFTVTGLPAVGSRLAPQATVAVTVLAAPRHAGRVSDALRITTGTGPAVTVALTGTAVSGAPELQLPAVVDVGDVPVGLSDSQDFPVANVGDVALQITKAKAPDGAFTASDPLAEGLTIPPGDTVHQLVTFTPAKVGPVEAAYVITGNDGAGAQTVRLRGRGVFDPIAVKYAQTGGASVFPPSLLGNPLSPEQAIPGGRMQAFTRGNIYWSRATGAHVVMGAILDEYVGVGGPAGVLGFPLTDELPAAAGGRHNDFAGSGGASIYWTPATGAHDVYGAVRDAWLTARGARGRYGYPVADQYAVSDGSRCDFQHGSITA